VEQLAAHEHEIENLKEMVGSFEGRGGLLARLHAQVAQVKRSLMDKADREEVNKRVVDTKKLERDIRAKIDRHVHELQAMLATTSGDAEHTRRLLEERADLTKSYSEALFDGVVKAVASRVNTMQRTTHQQMVEQLSTLDEDILRLERAVPLMHHYGRGHAAQRRAGGPRVPGTRFKTAGRAYNPGGGAGKQMYAWDIRGHKPLPLMPPTRSTLGPQHSGARRASRGDLGASPSPPSGSTKSFHRPATSAGTPESMRSSSSLPKLAIVGARQGEGGGVSRASIPRALAKQPMDSHIPQGAFGGAGVRTRQGTTIWATAEPTHPLTHQAARAAGRR